MQLGSLTTKSRLDGPDVWQFRWSEKALIPGGRKQFLTCTPSAPSIHSPKRGFFATGMMKFGRKMLCSFSDWRIPVVTTSTPTRCCRR